MDKDNSNYQEKNLKIKLIHLKEDQTRNEIKYCDINKISNNNAIVNNISVKIEMRSEESIHQDLKEVNVKFEAIDLKNLLFAVLFYL